MRLPNLYILIVTTCITLYLYIKSYSNSTPIVPRLISHPPANSTLGFGAIYAVSAYQSDRKDGLLQSANVTGLDIDIPPIPPWTKEQVKKFRDKDHLHRSSILDGSIRAWMSHAIVLQDFLRSGRQTALIIEDDVDWDIRLRSSQIPTAAAAHRSLLRKANSELYWGDPKDWDLLYLGHCGDYFSTVDGMQVGTGIVHPSDLEELPHVLYRDTTMPDPSDIHPFTASLLNAFNIPAKTRMIHRSKWPLCTFGYAITRSLAKQLLDELAPPIEIPGRWTSAYDIAILEACRDKGLRCFTVNPELFHHMEGTSLIDGVAHNELDKPPADRVGTKQVQYRNETSNIGCGFWSKDFRFDGDLKRLEMLRQEVGKKGRCLKPGRNDDGTRRESRILGGPKETRKKGLW